MTLLVAGDAASARERLTAALEAAGWRWVGDPANCGRLVPRTGDEDDLAASAWVALEPREGACRIALWLPEDVATREAGALADAVDKLAEGSPGAEEQALLRRLARIEGQIRGLQRMIADGRECEAVMTQFSAVASALKQTAARLIAAHLIDCVRTEVERGGELGDINQRLLNILF